MVFLAVDETGVGTPVIDLFRQEELGPVGVLIHGGDKASHEGESWRATKRDLVGAMQVAPPDRAAKGGRKAKAGAGIPILPRVSGRSTLPATFP